VLVVTISSEEKWGIMYLVFLIYNGPIWDCLEFGRQSKDRIVGESTKAIGGYPIFLNDEEGC